MEFESDRYLFYIFCSLKKKLEKNYGTQTEIDRSLEKQESL